MTIVYLDACCLNRPFDDQTQDLFVLKPKLWLASWVHWEWCAFCSSLKPAKGIIRWNGIVGSANWMSERWLKKFTDNGKKSRTQTTNDLS